jgi:hypothetical protein
MPAPAPCAKTKQVSESAETSSRPETVIEASTAIRMFSIQLALGNVREGCKASRELWRSAPKAELPYLE